jgi:hypothetical protein
LFKGSDHINFPEKAEASMSNIEQDDKGEQPLDPVLERVRRKMIRLQIISAAVMLVALMAVLIAIVYKVNRPAEAIKTQAVEQAVPTSGATIAKAALPEGFKVSSIQLANGQILFDGTAADGTRKALVFDIRLGHIVAEVTVGNP